MPKLKRWRRFATPKEFAEAAPIGTRVRYYPMLPADEDDFIESFVASEPWQMGGRTVVKIDGRAGGADVSHMILINPRKEIGGVVGFIYRR